jgi:hypothetical protein
VAHTKSQRVPSQVACDAPAGTGQGVHEPPQLCTSWLDEQRPPAHMCVPAGQACMHEALPAAAQAPPHSCMPGGHVPPHIVPSQVAVPPGGAWHGVQPPPQVCGSLLLTQRPAHRCWPALHVGSPPPPVPPPVPRTPPVPVTPPAPALPGAPPMLGSTAPPPMPVGTPPIPPVLPVVRSMPSPPPASVS